MRRTGLYKNEKRKKWLDDELFPDSKSVVSCIVKVDDETSDEENADLGGITLSMGQSSVSGLS